MMTTKKVASLLLLGLVAVGCDNKNPNPNQPGSSEVLTGVAITSSPDLMKLKETATFTLTASYSTGDSRPVQGTWRSDNQAVATVDGSGRVTSSVPGQATISAEYQGRTASQSLRVVPDYQGRWNGGFSITACSADGDWQRGNFCGEFAPGDLYALMLELNQTRDTVTGTADLGELPGPVEGSIRASGHLTLSGTMRGAVEGIDLEAALSDWESMSADNRGMTGRAVLVFRSSRLLGSSRVELELSAFGKTGLASLAAEPRAHPSIGAALARAIKRR